MIVVPTSVLASTSADITVTATGWICAAPGSFTLTYISDHEVGISWVKGEGAVNTMVRAAVGRLPEDRDDGYLIYYGDGTYATDTGISLDETAAQIFYKAWSQNANGVWEESGVSDFIEGVGMVLIALIILAIGFTISSYFFKKGMLAFGGAGAWAVTGVYCYTRAAEMWDVYYCLFWLCMGLTIACSFSPLAYRETTPAREEVEEPDVKTIREELETLQREQNQYAFLYSKRRPRGRASRYSRTGEE